MLDAVLAATEHLVVTYAGANETTGQPRPPAVPVGELLDVLDATAEGGRARALRRHPLQAFDARNLAAAAPFSFDPAALAGARAAAAPRVAPMTLSQVRLPATEGDVELGALVSFLKHPVREFLRRRLDLVLADEGEEVTDGLPVELDGLAQWAVGDRMLHDLLSGRSRDATLGKEWRRGVLPPGQLGWRLAQKILDQAAPVADVAASVTQGVTPSARDVDVDLGGGRRLRGTVTDLYADRVVKVSFSKLGPRHLIEAWVPLLALCAAHPGRGWSAGAIGRGDFGRASDRTAFASVEDAGDLLRDLVAIYDTGMREPLPLPLKTGHAWVRANPRAARAKADACWSRGRFGNENEDDAHVRVWGPDAPITRLLEARPRPGEEYAGQDTRLGALASRLWTPLLGRAR